MAKDKSMEKLAAAMSKLADSLEKFQDPILWQKVINDAIQAVPQLARFLPPTAELPAGELPSGRVEEVLVSLSDEERARLVTQVHEAIKPQLQEFSEFVQQSLKEMPVHRLKELAEKIERGEKAEIKRRHGCIFIAVGDTEIYLGL
ncbi:hypothetical protein ES705_42616 [subsurface metagenome]|jgi:hypothetical protein